MGGKKRQKVTLLMTQKIKPKSNHKFIFGRVGNIDYIYLIQKSRCFLNEVGRLVVHV